ncbi:amino acid permease [bacterium]|nr:amino acid permease [bacterium]
MSDELKRSMSLPDSISIVAGSMIGCGIFLVTADIARQVETAFYILLVWIIAGIVSLCGAIAYGELATNIPDEGGQYMYLKKIFNDKVAFLFGWTLFLVIQAGTIAAISVAFAKFAGLLLPWVSSSNNLFTIGSWGFSTQQAFALCVIVLLTYINSRGVEAGVITQNIFTVAKILGIIGIIICGILFGLNFETITSNFAPTTFNFQIGDIAKLSTATVGALFASLSWNNITFVAGEIKEPEKNVKKALLYGVGGVALLYVIVNVIYVLTTPVAAIQTAPEDIVAVVSMTEIFGEAGKNVLALIIMTSAFGASNGMVMAGARVYYKMAKDRLFFRSLAAINRKTRVPVNSLWAQCAWISALIFWGNYTQLLDFVIFAQLIFYVISIIGIFIYRRKNPDAFRVNSIFAIIFIVVSCYIILCLSIYKPTYTLPGLLITFAGLPVYSLWNSAKQKAYKERIKNSKYADKLMDNLDK